MIVVQPIGGLGNRLRVIASSLSLAKKTGNHCIILWTRDWQMFATFNELFNVRDNLFTVVELGNLNLNLTDNPFFNFFGKYLNKLHGYDFVFFDRSIIEFLNKNKENALSLFTNRNVFIQTCFDFQYDNLDYNFIIPNGFLSDKINGLTQNFNDLTIGLHIRRTDNESSIKNSPIEKFIELIDEKIMTHNIFLSTDDLFIQNQLVNKYGLSKIMFLQKEFRRTSIKGVQDAVIDLFCLSKTQKIYGSYFSSFSEVSSLIGDVPLEIISINS